MTPVQSATQARALHVARVGEFSRRSHAYFLVHGRKPPSKLRLAWSREIAAQFISR